MQSSTLPIPAAAATPHSTTSSVDDSEKFYQRSSRRTSRRRKLVFSFVLFVLLLVFLNGPINILGSSFSSVSATIGSWFSCHDTSKTHDMSFTPSDLPTDPTGEGWHARALEREASAKTTFEPAKEDLVLTVLINSQVEPEGFTMALFKPLYAVDASGRQLTLSKSDFEAIITEIEAVKELPSTGAFMGQWRVQHARTGFAIDRVLIPGHEEVSVYGWSKDTDVLESETKGFERLPAPLQRLVGLAKEARNGYRRGNRDDAVVDKVVSLTTGA